jgi:hypothetical protein
MTVELLKNWVWCEECLEWKDTDEVTFVSIEEGSFGQDLMTFECDRCTKTNISDIISSPTKPKGA